MRALATTASARIALATDKQDCFEEAGLGGGPQPRVSGGQESVRRARRVVSVAAGEVGGPSA
jgi:hypothetical protein